MKPGALNSITSGLSILSLSLLLIMSFSGEASAKREKKSRLRQDGSQGGCSAFGHSCFGGHGKRSSLNDETRQKDAELGSPSPNDVDRSSIDEVVMELSSNEIQKLRDFMKCRNCGVELSRTSRDDQNYMPLLLRQLLVAYRYPYNTDTTSNDK